jgi:hypothetical protein
MRRSGAGSPNGEVVWIFFPSTIFSFIGVIREIRGQKLLNNSGLVLSSFGLLVRGFAAILLRRRSRRILVTPMTAALAHIVGEIEALTPREKIKLRRHIVDRIPWAEDLNEDDYTELSAASFQALDEEEDVSA